MRKIYIYKITRSDLLEYIGITVDIPRRMYYHKKSQRFQNHSILKVEVLAESDNYEEAQYIERLMVEEYDTYRNGLNLTEGGQGRSDTTKFNTFGYTFSKSSKNKMRAKSIERSAGATLQKWKIDNPKKVKIAIAKMRATKQGKPNRILIDPNCVRQMVDLYIARPDIEDVGTTLKNGKILTYDRAFAKKYASVFSMTDTHITNIIKGKYLAWRHLLPLIQNTKS
jgi:predicted GIY-YIG superfamily endonuclease